MTLSVDSFEPDGPYGEEPSVTDTVDIRLRFHGMMGVHTADVNLDEEWLRINGGKAAKDRVVPLTQAAARFLESYIKGVRS